MRRDPRGSALIIGLVLLSLVSLLGLAAASTAHVELQLARNEQFRENAASAASAGLESAISRIVYSSAISTDSVERRASLPGTSDHFETVTRFLGFEQGLAQAPEANLAGAHFEIIATGQSLRARDRQRARVMLVTTMADPVEKSPCEPLNPGVPCVLAGALHRLSWQRLP